MNERSRLIGLMAKREAAQIADARRSLASSLRQQQATESLLLRLNSLLETRRSQAKAHKSAADLKEHRRMTEQLAIEAERSTGRLEVLRQEVAKAAEELAKRDHRKRSYEDAAQTARAAEIAERERLADLSKPILIRR